MPVIQRRNTLLTTELVENVFSGSAFEFLRSNAIVSIGIMADDPGAFFTLSSGSDLVVEESLIPDAAGVARFPIIPDEFYYSDVGVQGDRLVLRVRNPTGGTIVVSTVAQVTNL
jgi:hypothetical protein